MILLANFLDFNIYETLDSGFSEQIREYKLINSTELVKSINLKLASSYEHILSSLLMIFYVYILYIYLFSILKTIEKIGHNSKYLYFIIAVFSLILILSYKNKLYVNDKNNGEMMYYSSLLLLYNIVSSYDIKTFKNNKTQLLSIYKLMPNIVYQYITKQIEINKNNIVINILCIIFIIYILLLLYDVIMIIIYMTSNNINNIINNEKTKFLVSQETEWFTTKDNNPIQIQFKVDNFNNIYYRLKKDEDFTKLANLIELENQSYHNINTFINILIDENFNINDTDIKININSNFVTLNFIEKKLTLKEILTRYNIHYSNECTIKQANLIAEKIQDLAYNSSEINKLPGNFILKYQLFNIINPKINDNDESVIQISNVDEIIEKIQKLTFHDGDLLIFGILLFVIVIYIIINLYFAFYYKQQSSNQTTVDFNNILDQISQNYTNFILYSLEDRYKSQHEKILNDIVLIEKNKIFFKYILYINIILILFLILVLLLNRYNSITGIISAAIFMLVSDNSNVSILDLIIRFSLLILFISFLISLKIYLILLFNKILIIFISIIDNIDNKNYITSSFEYLNNLLLQNDSIKKISIFNGQINFNNVVVGKNNLKQNIYLNFKINKNKITILSHHASINIEKDIINKIKNRDENVSIFNEFNEEVSLKDISDKNLYKFFMYSSEFPVIIYSSLENNLWLGYKRSYITKEMINTLGNIIPIQSIYESCGAYYNNNINSVQNTSGGEKQRIEIARMIARYILESSINPKKQFFLCFNQSFSGIDKKTSLYILNQLKMLMKNNNLTILIITGENDYKIYGDKFIYVKSNHECIES